ncbi:PREDICTED: anoctamin-9 [Tinamus guttatus]|uniref:anoctamin-9 n=1 Tax=Tinamus guttatus TaxID=94827 RepID=UPI00052E9FA1|nr:PREDICTED: anoctamin-9 [Tinamus guttatus]
MRERGAKGSGSHQKKVLDEILLTPLRESEDDLEPPGEPEWDFVLVSDIHEMGSEKEIKRKKFLDELSKKGFTIKKIEDKKLFHGVRAPEWIFQKYQWLLRSPDSRLQSPSDQHNVPVTTRIRIVYFILHNTVPPDLEKLCDLMKKKVFETAFPLHEREEKKLFIKEKWARWRDICYEQPIENIRSYFGEKIALYFAWLGWYTCLLGIASVVGTLIFVFGITALSSSQVSKEICKANTTIMCPLCDQKCPFWLLSDTCTYAKIAHMIDNEGTVLFAMVMAIWATAFLELWKRHRATVVTQWNLYEWDDDEEELAMELINNPLHEPRRYQHSYFRSTIVILLVLLMIAVLIGIAHALVIYRVVAMALFTQSASEFIREHANTLAVLTGAVLHYFTIVIMTKVRSTPRALLLSPEEPRTFSQRENNFTVKIFTFQFFTNFSSLIYIAFFLGRARVQGSWCKRWEGWPCWDPSARPELLGHREGHSFSPWCHPSGCITDLFIQMATITILKQTLSNFVEYLVPWITHICKKQKLPKKKNTILGEEEEAEDPCKQWWLSNYQLNEVHPFSLFDEFLEMVIQYSYTTIFIAAFPLAPVLAFINNLVEIRLDAIKMVHFRRRMVPRKANDIGIWLQVLEAIGILAVIGNGLVIAITSDFIPMQVYKYTHSPCATGNSTALDCLSGYINHSLSTFRTRDFEPHMRLPAQLPDFARQGVTECRYREYRNADDYSYTAQFWHVFAARLAFLILFEVSVTGAARGQREGGGRGGSGELPPLAGRPLTACGGSVSFFQHVALCVKFIAAWYVPDVPQSVKNHILDEKYTKLQKELSTMEYSTDV